MIGIIPPVDITKEERKIIDAIAVDLYRKLNDPVDKFITAMVFDVGYGKEQTAEALGITYTAVYQRIKKIRKKLSVDYAGKLRKSS